MLPVKFSSSNHVLWQVLQVLPGARELAVRALPLRPGLAGPPDLHAACRLW
jgi:hypothetical protein